jgi:hypothetical protein
MTFPTFTLDTDQLTLSKGVNYPIIATREQVQAVDRTAAGTLQVESLGALIKRITIDLSNLTAGDYAALLNWFDNVAIGAANEFTYTDQEDNSYQTRWVNQFNFEESKAGYSGSIELEIVG